MQTEGLPTLIGVVTGLLFGLTSLQYNRARAYQAGPTQRRSLMAAELSLRATLLTVAGAIVTSIIWAYLAEKGFQPTRSSKFPIQFVPAFLALVPVAFFVGSVIVLSRATRIVAHGSLVPPTLRRIKRNL